MKGMEWRYMYTCSFFNKAYPQERGRDNKKETKRGRGRGREEEKR
jgi:hypothetical protein